MNLTIKTIVSLNWFFNVYNTDMFLKFDDDVLLNVTDVHQTVSRYLHSNKSEYAENTIAGWCYSGVPVIRNVRNKLGVSNEEYSPPTYPRFCIGLSYAITRSAVSNLLNQTHNTPLIHLEDISLGILAQKAGNIKLISIPNWRNQWNGNMNMNLARYRRYHTIHTFQGRVEKLQKLWKNIST